MTSDERLEQLARRQRAARRASMTTGMRERRPLQRPERAAMPAPTPAAPGTTTAASVSLLAMRLRLLELGG